MAAGSTKIVAASGNGAAWEVVSAQWKPSVTPYPHLYIDVQNAAGQTLHNVQVSVRWHGGSTILMPGGSRNHTVSMPITNPADVYIIAVAGGSGQAVQARGAENSSLYVVLQSKN